MARSASGLAVLFGISVVACASSSTPTTTSTSGNSSCSCTASINGEDAEIKCGSSQCVAGATYSCAAGAELTQGEPCTPSSDGGSAGTTNDSGTVGTGSGCGLFTCRTTSDCGGIAPCFSASDGNNYCYEQEANASACSPGATATTKTTSNGPTTICTPPNCPPPGSFIQ